MISCIPDGDVNEWTLDFHRPVLHWIETKAALIGDSCHPMLPHVAQGAAQAIEDAGALTVALGLAEDLRPL